MLKSWISKRPDSQPLFSPVSPEVPCYLIGDIHGQSDLLGRLLDKLVPGHPVFFVGDYVDRGEDSAGVIRMLMERTNTYCIKGNHEEMLLSFLDDPVKHGPRWLRYGGLQTLASYGVSGVTETCQGSELEGVRNALYRAMGPEQVFWLRSLPLYHLNGNIAIVHAGADPRTDIHSQTARDLLWGHRDFGKVPRTDGLWVAHGHTIVDHPFAEQGIISVDTGAYATGRITVAGIGDGAAEFLVLT